MPPKIINMFYVQNKIDAVEYESCIVIYLFLVIPVLFVLGQEFVTNAFLLDNLMFFPRAVLIMT